MAFDHREAERVITRRVFLRRAAAAAAAAVGASALDLALPGLAAACLGCPQCQPICPWGVPIGKRMRRAHPLLAGSGSAEITCYHEQEIA
jgi:hypothetical protein